MRLLDSAAIQPEEIDNLGHLNVRHYLLRVYRGNQQLMELIGLPREARRAAGAVLGRAGSYTRYHREQRLGATLEVRGGILDIAGSEIRTFCEIRNAESGEVAATFLSELVLEAPATRAPLPWPAETPARAEALRVALPDYGAPRTLTLDPPRLDVTFEAVLARVGEDGDGGYGTLAERTIAPEDCDSFGYLSDGGDLMQGALRAAEPPIVTGEGGLRFGWAVLESRMIQYSRPRRGDVLRSIGAVVGLQRKARHTRRWTFDAASGQVAATDDTVSIALDLAARRAIEIPAALREEICARHHAPEFA
jgi:acyl-CoA thioester hydrolase